MADTFKSRWVSTKAVGTFVPTLTRKAFERHGFASATLITEWPAIVGADLARKCTPLKLKWPRAPQQPGSSGANDEVEPRAPATLHLRVEPAFALDLQYAAPQVMERINAHFGYRAVGQIRLVQGAVAQPRPARAPGDGRPADTRHAAQDRARVAAETDAQTRLQAVLNALETNVKRRAGKA